MAAGSERSISICFCVASHSRHWLRADLPQRSFLAPKVAFFQPDVSEPPKMMSETWFADGKLANNAENAMGTPGIDNKSVVRKISVKILDWPVF